VTKPAGLVTGDVLVAQVTSDGAPSVAAAPSGWSPVITPLAVGSSARVFAYSHVVADASSEPASWTWQLSVANKWNAGVTAFRGVNTSTPFDSAAATRVNASPSASVTVPEVITTVAGAVLVGGVGVNNGTLAVSQPSGWTETFESSGAQVAEMATQARPAAGATGPATWTLGVSQSAAGWARALRPASAGGTTTPPPTTTPPVAAFTASPASGTAPLVVRFTDTSAGSPTAWAWDFGDGSTATAQNPEHTFAAEGSYTATLRSTNSAGTSAPATQTITVSPATQPPPAGGGAGIVVQASSKTASPAEVTSVRVDKPAGLASGDVVIAQLTVDDAPSISAAPAGWDPVITPLAVSSSARVFAYYHVVADATVEPASWSWQLSAAKKWNAVATAFRGVDTSTPFDSVASARVNTSVLSSVTVPGLTTATAGAMLVGGVGVNSATNSVTQPSGWTESAEAGGGQVAELAHQLRATAGVTGTATWTLSPSFAAGGWMRALRPAA
jgi:PKD repeat protein